MTFDGNVVRIKQAYYNGTTTTTTLFLAGGTFEVEDPGVSETITRYYTIAGQRVAVNDGTDLHYMLTNHLGSTVAVLDDTDFGYTGQRDLGNNTDLMDYNARFYGPVLGRFTQADTKIPNPANPQTLGLVPWRVQKAAMFQNGFYPYLHLLSSESFQELVL